MGDDEQTRFQMIVDVGTGSGTHAVALKLRCPTVRIVALDPDPDALALDRHFATRSGRFSLFARAA